MCCIQVKYSENLVKIHPGNLVCHTLINSSKNRYHGRQLIGLGLTMSNLVSIFARIFRKLPVFNLNSFLSSVTQFITKPTPFQIIE